MFTMMNNARLAVGMQGVGVAEAATQRALAYAKERRQGRAENDTERGMSPIVLHPDVRRMLATMEVLTWTARAISYCCAHAIDMARLGGDRGRHWNERAGLLTPLAKAWSTDVGVEVASLGIQVHGGMGFIEETGAAALLRDARIAPIYEGTNGIQAIDLVTRKLPLSGGDQIRSYIAELRADVEALSKATLGGVGRAVERLSAAIDDVEASSTFMLDAIAAGRMREALSGATPYLRLLAMAAGGTYLARAAVAAPGGRHVALCRFFAENLVVETAILKDRITNGADSLACVELG